MDFDVTETWTTVQRLINGFMAMLPRILLALVIFGIFVALAKGVRALVVRRTARSARHNLGMAVGRLAQAGMLLMGALIGVTAAFPTFTPGRLISLLGLGGVAIGFAFKDIFQNFLAGILILITEPFVVGDQIRFKDFEGTVEDIQTRATFVKTYDGRRAVIPNGELYTNAVIVNTAFPQRRWQYDIGIGYGDDIEKAREVILRVLGEAEGVAPDPKADVIVVDLAGATVNLRARWWTDSKMADGLIGQDLILTAVKQQLTAQGIDLPFPTQQILLHDQTEETDGDRRRQREGWPAGTETDAPAAQTVAGSLREAAKAQTQRNDGRSPAGGE